MNKACPVVIRKHNNKTEILAFKHPIAGFQIVKGTIEIQESLKSACERELLEESGIVAKSSKYLGIWESHYQNQIWGFYLMTPTVQLENS